jgi:hypothetical protein
MPVDNLLAIPSFSGSTQLRPVSAAPKLLGTIAAVGMATSVAAGPAFAQSSSKRAIELIRLSLKCPPQPETFNMDASRVPEVGAFTTRSTTAVTYEGDEKTFKIVYTETKRSHWLINNKTSQHTYAKSFQARIADFESVELYEPSAESGTKPSVHIRCSDDRKCFKPSYGGQNISLGIDFCDMDKASDAKAGLDELIRLNSVAASRPPASSPHERSDMRGYPR